ncbi:MAG: DUF4363 family protein [Peptococcaceae bacterium]|nr:DUF4363 family protein [Peptococcaceae bacterium]
MRLLVVLTIIFVAILSFGFWTNHLLQDATDEMVHKITQIEQALEESQWEQALANTDELEETWKEKTKWWPSFLDHQEIDNIEFTMTKTREYIAKENTPLSWAHLAELKLMIKHVPKKESLTIENIF